MKVISQRIKISRRQLCQLRLTPNLRIVVLYLDLFCWTTQYSINGRKICKNSTRLHVPPIHQCQKSENAKKPGRVFCFISPEKIGLNQTKHLGIGHNQNNINLIFFTHIVKYLHLNCDSECRVGIKKIFQNTKRLN